VFGDLLKKFEERNLERTFLMVKPDGVQRNLVGEVIRRLETKGFTLVGLKLMNVSSELAEQHYDCHKKGLSSRTRSVHHLWPGGGNGLGRDGVIASARKIIGATNPLNAEPGTIRGDYGVTVGRNLIHGSDAPETAQQEISLWFKEEELVSWQPSLTTWLYE
jgi:nucleoside-diphosphate kinase